MEAVIGIRGLDYVLLASDRRAARSIVVMKSTEVKTRDLSRSVGMAYCGEPGSAVEFAEYVQANTRLYAVRNGYSLTASEAAHYARRLLADALRTRSPYQTNILVGGFGGLEENSVKPEQKNASKEGPRLYTIDHLATLAELPFAAHGYAAYFVLSLMDRHYRPEMTLEEGMALLRMCLAELKTRFIVGLPEFTVQIIKPSGIQETILSS